MALDKDVRFTEKKVDASWKEEITKESKVVVGSDEHGKQQEEDQDESSFSPFMHLISSLGMQALIQLGELEDPTAKQQRRDIAGARATIDLLIMLKEKTDGNLDRNEGKLLDSLIYDLQMKFVENSKKPQ